MDMRNNRRPMIEGFLFGRRLGDASSKRKGDKHHNQLQQTY
jgi:hypothetical protein